LIRLGAKYTPCMRTHEQVQTRYETQARIESMSGCCIHTATGRCMQTLAQQCLVTMHFFLVLLVVFIGNVCLGTSRSQMASNSNEKQRSTSYDLSGCMRTDARVKPSFAHVLFGSTRMFPGHVRDDPLATYNVPTTIRGHRQQSATVFSNGRRTLFNGR
jgi:hypothetical protein